MKKYLFGLHAAPRLLGSNAAKAGIAILLALTSCLSFAATDRILREGENSAILLIEPCTLPFLSEDVQKQLGAARLHIEGKDYKGCFMEKNGSVMIIDEEEDVYGPFPANVFVPTKEA